MKYLLVLIITALSNVAVAQIPTDINDLKIVRENLDFIESRDPGYIELKDMYGEFTVWHFYDFIEYENIKNWKKDEKIDVAQHEKQGYGIIRHKDQMFYKVLVRGSYKPIKEKQQECMKNANTTADMVSCYKTSAVEWRTEYLFTYHHLQKRLPEEIAKMVEDTEKDLKTLADSYFATYKKYLDYMGGSIRYIQWAHADADFQEMRYDALLNFYF